MGVVWQERSKDSVIAEMVAGKGWTENIEVLDSSKHGREVYFLLRDKNLNKKFIALALVSSYKGRETGVKMMDECAGPYYYNCPEKFLKASEETYPGAVEWRNKCRAMRVVKALKKEVAADLKAGDVIEAAGFKVEFEKLYKTTQFIGKILEGKGAGNRYRFRIKDIKVSV